MLTFSSSLPEGFRSGALRTRDIKMINDSWAGRFGNSETFIEEAIRLNPSMGIYNAEDELISWIMRYFPDHVMDFVYLPNDF